MNLSPPLADALHRALHSTSGADERWRDGSSFDDEALTQRIAAEFGIMGGFGAPGVRVEFRGGKTPRITIEIGDGPGVELEGRELLAATREVLQLRRPGELF
jgi:hypothetical protein